MFVPIEGRGRSVISTGAGEDFVVEWGERDIFIVPSWHRHKATQDADAVLFSYCDRPIQEALYLYRKDRGHV